MDSDIAPDCTGKAFLKIFVFVDLHNPDVDDLQKYNLSC